VLTLEHGPDGETRLDGGHQANLRAALKLRPASRWDWRPEPRSQREKLRAATPDVVGVVSVRGHGYTDPRGALYLVPYDVGAGRSRISDALSGASVRSSSPPAGERERHQDAGRYPAPGSRGSPCCPVGETLMRAPNIGTQLDQRAVSRATGQRGRLSSGYFRVSLGTVFETAKRRGIALSVVLECGDSSPLSFS